MIKSFIKDKDRPILSSIKQVDIDKISTSQEFTFLYIFSVYMYYCLFFAT